MKNTCSSYRTGNSACSHHQRGKPHHTAYIATLSPRYLCTCCSPHTCPSLDIFLPDILLTCFLISFRSFIKCHLLLPLPKSPTRPSLLFLHSTHHHLTHYIFILLIVCLCRLDYKFHKGRNFSFRFFNYLLKIPML